MLSPKVTLESTQCGVNRVVNALDWGEHGQVAYAAQHMVVIYDPQVGTGVGTRITHRPSPKPLNSYHSSS